MCNAVPVGEFGTFGWSDFVFHLFCFILFPQLIQAESWTRSTSRDNFLRNVSREQKCVKLSLKLLGDNNHKQFKTLLWHQAQWKQAIWRIRLKMKAHAKNYTIHVYRFMHVHDACIDVLYIRHACMLNSVCGVHKSPHTCREFYM